MKPWLNIIVLIVLAGGLRADETFARTVQPFFNTYCVSVSYTHLTLPTKA